MDKVVNLFSSSNLFLNLFVLKISVILLRDGKGSNMMFCNFVVRLNAVYVSPEANYLVPRSTMILFKVCP